MESPRHSPADRGHGQPFAADGSKGLTMLGETVTWAGLANIRSNTIREVLIADTYLATAEAQAEEVIAGIQSRNFHATPKGGEMGPCSICDFKDLCRHICRYFTAS